MKKWKKREKRNNNLKNNLKNNTINSINIFKIKIGLEKRIATHSNGLVVVLDNKLGRTRLKNRTFGLIATCIIQRTSLSRVTFSSVRFPVYFGR